ncbi:L,D-transpeptidase [Streptacidiphilus jiangxiensis]|uniref:Lipoprotein-anchoring transpeptidase ErfK/SrfK n=1 Tax=Streptacidiphilus jiangxiensis TaxID=235985 RepID=A0A1H7PL90_STRJI|nr:L,D-transpeptidase [Streptacidiphilus jiangxiensis]SEL36346.1 Lipoprotein-anchoring transpeptidase ErfK/SrfK [Streptacidiphilus jiangxiensis]
MARNARPAAHRRYVGIAVLTAAVLLGATACSDGSATAAGPGSASAQSSSTGGTPGTGPGSTSPSPTHPAGPPLLLDTIAPADGATVGVAMPVSVEFTHPVAPSARAAVEQAMKVTTSSPVTGAWHWFSNTRADWRPKQFWPAGTRVSVDARLTGIADGNGRYGIHDYHHAFTIGADWETKVDAAAHTMDVYLDSVRQKHFPIDAGSAQFPTWDGTMAEMEKAPSVHMTSCSVHITCDPANVNFYDVTLPWDVRLTTSGTFVHYSTAHPNPGQSTSHGCIHLSLADSQWFYAHAHPGDPVTVTGSPRGPVPGDNGYAAFTLDWSTWLAGSATGAQQTTS